MFVNETEDELLLILILRQCRIVRLCQGHSTFSCVVHHSQAFGSGLKVLVQLVALPSQRIHLQEALLRFLGSAFLQDVKNTIRPFGEEGIKADVPCVFDLCPAWVIFNRIFRLHPGHAVSLHLVWNPVVQQGKADQVLRQVPEMPLEGIARGCSDVYLVCVLLEFSQHHDVVVWGVG